MLTEIVDDLHAHFGVVREGSVVQADDQRWMMRYYFRHQQEVGLDVNGELFCTLHGMNADDLVITFTPETGLVGVVIKRTGSTPVLIHGNGADGKQLLMETIDQLPSTCALHKL